MSEQGAQFLAWYGARQQDRKEERMNKEVWNWSNISDVIVDVANLLPAKTL